MRKNLSIIIALTIIVCFVACPALSQDAKRDDPNQLFYTGNHYYQARDYIKAVEEYVKLLDMGIENGNLYYNIGNGFLKLGKVGYAILCYEKARRLIPHDSDLKANLVYARSLIDEVQAEDTHKNIIVRLIRKMCSDLSLRSIAKLTIALYLALILLLAFFIFNPVISLTYFFLFINLETAA